MSNLLTTLGRVFVFKRSVQRTRSHAELEFGSEDNQSTLQSTDMQCTAVQGESLMAKIRSGRLAVFEARGCGNSYRDTASRACVYIGNNLR
jgi:hypothetical protein